MQARLDLQGILVGQSNLDLDRELAALQQQNQVVVFRFANSSEDVGIVPYETYQQVL